MFRPKLICLFAAMAMVIGPVYAQSTTGTAAPPAKQEEKKDETKPPEKSEDEKEIEKFDKAIKDAKALSGAFQIYWKEKKILLALPEEDLGKLVYLQGTLNTGAGENLQAGDPLNQNFVDVFRFEKFGDAGVRLVKPNLKFRWKKDDPLALASSRSFPDAYLANFSIEAKHPQKKLLLIDIAKMFDGNLQELPRMIGAMLGPGYVPDGQNSEIATVKSFAENSVVRMNLHFRKASSSEGEGSLLAMLLGLSGPPVADGRSLPLTLTFNMWWAPDNGYQPRLGDPRVGYFTEDYFDVTKMKEVDRNVRLINRFDLRKKNPAAAQSEPVEPIVWYLDHSVPKEYRAAVTEGILFWNKAFEKLGYVNAIQVKDAPNDPDWDHADGRYNVIRWTMSEGTSYAVAWFRTDPVTGQIMNAAVTVDANYPAGTLTEFKEQVIGPDGRMTWQAEAERAQNQLKLDAKLKGHGLRKLSCDHAHGLIDSAKEGWAMLQASESKVTLEEYTRQMIADLIAHEVGHCLGLRHNFAASTQLPVSDLSNLEMVAQKAIAASVMDYVPINIQAVLDGQGYFYNPTIGVYDLWAIEYGYSPAGGLSPEAEVPFLNALARRSGEPGLLYLTDEDADGVNPLAVRWDIGANTLDYLESRLRANARMYEYALNNATGFGETYTRRNALLLRVIRGQFNGGNMAARMIGGVEFRRHLKGDIGEKPTLQPVSPAQQRAALQFIAKEVLMLDDIPLPQSVLYGMAGDPNGGNADYIAPLRGYIGMQQRAILAQIVSSEKFDAILENQFKTRTGDSYTIHEHLDGIVGAVYAEVGADQVVPALRRDLQRFMLTMLIGLDLRPGGLVNDDVRILSHEHLKNLKKNFDSQLNSAKLSDRMTRLHLKDMSEQIDRHMKRQTVVPPQ